MGSLSVDGFQFYSSALRVLVLAQAVLGVLLAVIATAIAAWRFLRGVPRAFSSMLVRDSCYRYVLLGRRVSSGFLEM